MPYPDPLPLNEATSADLERWVSASKRTSDHKHAVYVLDCTPPEGGRDFRVKEFIKYVQQKVDNNQPLDKLERAAYATSRGQQVFYVGYTNDVVDRVGRHLTGAAGGGAKFTNRFTPQLLVDVHWYRTERTAREQERETESQIRSKDGSYAYSE